MVVEAEGDWLGLVVEAEGSWLGLVVTAFEYSAAETTTKRHEQSALRRAKPLLCLM